MPEIAEIELVVVIHGLFGGRKSLEGVCAAIKAARPGAEFHCPRMPYAGWYSGLNGAKPEAVMVKLLKEIDDLWSRNSKEGRPFKRISFVGHSVGAIFARKAVILANGQLDEDGKPSTTDKDIPAPFEPGLENLRAPRNWANKIDRLVLIAGMNRGWSSTETVDWWTGTKFSIGTFFGEVRKLITRRDPLVFAARRGSPFLIQTRLQWLELMKHSDRRPTAGFQFIGTDDDLVSPADYVDSAVDFNDQSPFKLVQLPYTNHENALTLQPPAHASKTEQDRVQHRFDLIRSAFTADPINELRHAIVSVEEMSDSLPEKPDKNVTDVVFVIHGIRSRGFWTSKIAARIKKEFYDTFHQDDKRAIGDAYTQADTYKKVRSFTASYGYFSMLPFALWAVRRRKVEWLMDEYTRLRAIYPSADFSYVGHSNGTYLLASALEHYPAARFKRVVLAGSVVRRAYDWNAVLARRKKDAALLNFVADKDWIVGVVSRSISVLTDVGSAGFRGFLQLARNKPKGSDEIQFVAGGHNTGVTEPYWNDIAKFIVRGETPTMKPPQYSNYHVANQWRIRMRRTLYDICAFCLLPIILALLISFGLYLWPTVSMMCLEATPPQGSCSPAMEAWRVFAFLTYAWAIYVFITRW